MTSVVPALANVADQETSSESLRRWSELHQQWLRTNVRRERPQVTSTPLKETIRGAQVGLDAVKQQGEPQVDERRASAVRSAFRRLESESIERLEIPIERITGMEKWEGRVIDVDDDIFSAELRPLYDGPDVIADFPKSGLAEGDVVQVGDVIYVTARTVKGRGGPTHTSTIRLRRLGRWTEAEIADQAQRAREQAAELSSYVDD
jgi:hypothetical protein